MSGVGGTETLPTWLTPEWLERYSDYLAGKPGADELAGYVNGTIPAGALSDDAQILLTSLVQQYHDEQQATQQSGAIPVLDPPAFSDATALLKAYLVLRVETGNLEQQRSVGDVEDIRKQQESRNKEVAAKMKEVLDKMEKAQNAGKWMKILSWVGVVVGIIAAAVTVVATGGLGTPAVLAIVGAVLGATMATLEETGAMEKITAGVAYLVKECFGASEEAAKEAAKWIMLVGGALISIALGGVSIGSAFRSAGQVASTAVNAMITKLKMLVDGLVNNLSKILQRVLSIIGSLTTIAQQAAAVDGAIQSSEAANKTADAAEIKKFLVKLQAMLEEETERLKQMIQQMQECIANAMRIISGQTEQQAETIRNMA